MKYEPLHTTRFFYATSPLACPYIPGRVERRVVTELMGRDVAALHDSLSRAGFRRSHGIAYAPACPECSACQALRTVVDEFEPSRSQRRVLRLNFEVRGEVVETVATAEQFDLFVAYQRSRHDDGDMARMNYADFQALVEETPVETWLVEYRDAMGVLIGVCLADRMGDGFSAVYNFFDPAMARRSPGTFMILWLIEQARRLGLPYVYLGFWIDGCAKMAYKDNFKPVEVHTPRGWRALGDEQAEPIRAPIGQPMSVSEN